MKKLLLLLFLLGSFIKGGAQSWIYHPFPSGNAVWMTEWIDSDGGTHYIRSYQSGDTTIGSNTYHSIFLTNVSGLFSGGIPDYNYNSKYFIGGLREDIADKKVYYYSEDEGTESLLYDFSLNLGDVAFIDSINSIGTDTIIVSGFDSVQIGGLQHRRILLQNSSTSGPNPMPGNWIEGVGSEAGLLQKFIMGFEFAYNLKCFTKDGVYQLPGNYMCAYEVGINEMSDNNSIKFGPNPSSGSVTLSINCNETYSITRMNDLGKMIWSKRDLQLTEINLDLNSYPAGVYFIRLLNLKGESIVKKVVKE